MIVTKSYLFKPVRRKFKRLRLLYKLITCPQCFGVWAGLLFVFNPFFEIDFIFAISFLGWLASKFFYE